MTQLINQPQKIQN